MENTPEIVLRPLRLGEILDQAIRLYRHNFLILIGIIALAEIPLLLVQIVLPLLYKSDTSVLRDTSTDIFTAHWFITNAAIFFVHWVFVDGLGSAVLTYAIARSYLHQKTAILEAYRQVGFSWVKLLVILFVFALLLLIVILWALIPCIGWFSSPGVLIFLVMAVKPLIPAAMVIEKQGGLNAILRAWDLARRRFLWILGFDIVLILFNWIVAIGPSFLLTLLVTGTIGSLAGQSATFETVYPLVASVSGILFSVVFLPIQTAAWTLVYFDLRVRTEAFDLALLSVGETQQASRQVALPAFRKWLLAEDVAKFFLTSLLIAGFFVMVYVVPIVLLFVAVASENR